MTNEELKKKIIDVLCGNIEYELRNYPIDNYSEVVFDYEKTADALIAAGIGDVKEIKYRVRRSEKALYIACRETAEIIFKDDFDRHAQEHMYGYLKQAEKDLEEEEQE